MTNVNFKVLARKFALPLGLAVISCSLTAHGVPAANAATLRIGLANDVDILDPTLLRTFASIQVLNAMCDKLIDLTPDLRFVPQLATAWMWSDDRRILTLKLRSGVKFHDGIRLMPKP
jgi:peptide/nickel transport system substrate-binding protein